MKLLKSFVLLILLFSISGLYAQNPKRHFKLEDLQKLVGISNPQISPDGNQVAFVVSRVDWKNDKRKQVIELANLNDGLIRKLTYNREGISNLAWSPDGKKLAFIAKEVKTKETQIYIMSMNGGDPICITDSKTGITEFSWSPNGKKIAYVAQDTIPNPKEIKHHEDAFKVTDNNYMVRKEIQPWHLWIVSSSGGQAKQLTKGSYSLCTDQETISPVEWTHDGKSILFQKFPNVWEGNAWHSKIAIIDTDGTNLNTFISDEGSGHQKFSPQNNMISFMRARNGDLNNGNAVYLKSGDKINDITKSLARNINNYVWMPDGKSLLLTGEKGVHTVIWKQPVNGEATQIDLGNLEISNSSIDVAKNGAIVFTASTSQNPYELYYLSSISSKPKRITNFNSFIDSVNIAESKGIDWIGPEDFNEDGVLTYPINYNSKEKYPLVLVIHGGPEGASTLRFSDLAQLLAAKGFFVFQPNYRGSINLGDKYQHAIARNTGEGPGKDVMAGLKKIVAMGIIDTNNIGVTGWSYGGYMTSWLTGYYPNKWKAAVEGAALNDWVMDYTIAYYQTYDLYFFGGSPWVTKYWDIWREQSPIIFAKNVKAPTLIMGDAGDGNVPIVNSYEMYHALKDNGVTTEFYVYPVDTHFPGDIVRRSDVYKKWVDWMVKYLK